MAKLAEPTVGIIDKSSTFFEKSTPEELDAYYQEARRNVVTAREHNNGAIPNNWGQAKSDEKFCIEYKKDESRRKGADTQDRLRKEYLQGNDRSYKLTKKSNDDADI